MDATKSLATLICNSSEYGGDNLNVVLITNAYHFCKAKTIRTGAYHFCSITCAASKVPQGENDKNRGLSFQNSAIPHT